jgi:predicted acylesterase/phospholipase RssA
VTDFDKLNTTEYVEALASSASVPSVFPYQIFEGKKLSDGG